MGSPISVVAAEMTMQQLEKDILSSPPCDVKFWKRFVDDTIAVIPSNSVDQFLEYLNSLNTNIQFTCETEQNKQIPFLDILIRR